MPITTAYEAKVDYLSILDEHGNFDEELGKDLLSDADVRQIYEQMIICRHFDDTAFMLQRSGRLGTFPQNRGNEATSLGAARAMKKGHDFLVPYYRENAAAFWHGLPMHYIYLHWMGDERGNQIPKGVAMTPLSIAIGTQTLHAAGIAWAFKLRKEKKAVVCFMGDGATSTGDWHEGMNFASVFKLPVVYTCINNQWAISVPTRLQTGAETFAQKGLAYGTPSIRVDGNDLFAVYKAHKDAIERAHRGEGPSFIEAVTYRLADHTTADDARRYRPGEEFEDAQKRDPLLRTRKYLEKKGVWNDDLQAKTEERAKLIIREVVDAAMKIEKPTVDDIFDYTFAELNEEILKQKRTHRTESLGQEPEQVGLKTQAAEVG
jgi:pyruvate dehydrogenase E1 component alpha subunit